MTTTTSPQTANGIVIYSDGGCKPSRGIGGWGIHGYIYNEEVPKKGLGLAGTVAGKKGYTTQKNDAVTILQYFDGYGSLIPESTNNEAELTAAITGCDLVIDNHEKYRYKDVTILCDSKYVIDGISSWVHTWVKNGWVNSSGNEVANVVLWKDLCERVKKIDELELNLEFLHVDGHSGDVGNDKADLLASQGVVVGKKQIAKFEISYADPQGYWNDNEDYNRMLTLPKWYFNTNVNVDIKSFDDRWVYYCGTPGKNVEDEMHGKKVSDASFSILYLKEQIPELAAISRYQNAITPVASSTFVIGRLDNVTTSRNLKTLRTSGELFLARAAGPDNNLELPNKHLMTMEMNPPRRAYALVDNLQSLNDRLDQYLKNDDGVTVTDITDILYEVDRSKKVPVCQLRKEFISALKSVKVDVNYDVLDTKGVEKITLTFGINIANRNALSALAKRNPRVKVVTWRESDMAFRYATIVEDDNDVGIWAAIYANIRLLTSK